MIKKRKYVNLLFVFLIIVLIGISYDQYQEKKMYESYISESVTGDMLSLIKAIIENQKIYEEVLDTGEITRYYAERLRSTHYSILEIPQKYENLAFRFGRIESGVTQNKTAGTAQRISGYFSDMIGYEKGAKDNFDDVMFEHSDDMEEKIVLLKELNTLWFGSVQKNVVGVTSDNGEVNLDGQEFQNYYGDNSVSHDFWIDLVVDLDENTRIFLHENRLSSIEELLEK